MSQYGRLLIRSIRLVTETYNIAIQIYMPSESRLLSQSIRSGRDALYSYSIFKMSQYGHLLVRSIRPVTETYNIVIQIYSLFEGCLLSQSIRSGRDVLYSYSIFKMS
ncbi:hypothetical protein GIB67_036603, partial [Kingdonia uniflora]